MNRTTTTAETSSETTTATPPGSPPGSPPAQTEVAPSPLWLRLAGAPLAPFSTLSAVGLPPGTKWANWFALANALSWSIALGAPLILYARSLGAGDALLGVLAAIPPLLVVLHVPGAHLLPRLGYRRMMIFGWGARSLVLLGVVATALFCHSPAARLFGLFLCIMIFSTVRGLAGGAWMPWVSELIPEDVRGKFFLRDQLFGQSGNFAAILIAGAVLLGHPQPWQFAILFLLAATGGAVSVWCLTFVPDIAAPPHTAAPPHIAAQQTPARNATARAAIHDRPTGQPAERVSLPRMMRNKTFRRMCVFNVLYMLVLGALNVFTITYLRGVAGFSESAIVLCSGMAVFGGVLSLFWCGRVLDRAGSKPVMALSLLVFVLIFMAWWGLAGRALAPHPLTIGLLYTLMGMAGLNFAAANNRLQSLVIPRAGRNHYFAIFLVAVNGAAGLSPLTWGFILGGIGAYHTVTGAIQWNRYSIYFGCGTVMAAGLLLMLGGLTDKPVLETAAAAQKSNK